MIGCAVAPDALSLSLSRPAPKFQGYNLAHVPTSCSHGKNLFERYLLLQVVVATFRMKTKKEID